MATKILDLCLNVEEANVVVGLQPNPASPEPLKPDYWFQVYRSKESGWDPVQGSSVTVTEIGKCRIVAWDECPSTAPEVDFTRPNFASERVLRSIEGGKYSIGNASDFDPWPPT